MITSRAASVSMLVYIDLASQVKKLAFGGRGGRFFRSFKRANVSLK